MATEPLRYAMVLDEGAQQGVERLRVAYKLKSKADVYELATRVLTWVSDQAANGHEVGRFVDGHFYPLLMPYEIDRRAWKSSSENGQ